MSADLVIEAPRTRPASGAPRARAAVVRTSARGRTGPSPGLRSRPSRRRTWPPESLPGWRALLESHWRARLERVTELSLAYHDAEEAAAGEGGRPGRPLLRQAVAERRVLAEIEAALSRLRTGCFGRCERCGGVIPAARLTRSPRSPLLRDL